MKTKVFKLLALVVIPIMTFSCLGWNPCHSGPNEEVIFKTRGDYFDLVQIGIIDGKFTYLLRPVVVNGDTVNPCKIRLEGNYVFDFCGISRTSDIFLSLTWGELYRLEKELDMWPIPHEVLKKFILDTDPFIRFYKRKDWCPPFFEPSDSLRLNEMIRNGTLSRYFKCVK